MAISTDINNRNFFLGDERYSNEKYRVIISGYNANGKENFTIYGTTQTEFSIAGSNDFNSERGEAIKDVVSDVSSNLGGVGRAVGSIAGLAQSANTYSQASSGRGIVSRTMSEVIWQGSGKPEFNIDLTFVCLSADDPRESVVNRVGALMRLVYPDGGELLTPPLGYNVKGNSNAGKIAVQIGKWFTADKLVCTNCNFNFAKEVNKNGEPIYATGSVTLTPYRLVTYDEFKKFFPNFKPVFKPGG